MTTFIDLIQGSNEWHEHRRKYRNASETPAVMGLSPWLTPYGLWEIKTGRKVQAVTFPMQRGMELEPKARTAYEEETGIVMEPAVMVDGEYSASLDGITFDGELTLEVKCPMKGKDSGTWKAVAAGKLPEHYYWQVQHQLMVSGAKAADFYVFDGTEGLCTEVLPVPEDMDRLKIAWEKFAELVKADTPPSLTEADVVIREDGEWKTAAEQFIEAKLAAEQATRAIEVARLRLSLLLDHDRAKGCGISVSRLMKGGEAGKNEVRVTLLRV